MTVLNLHEENSCKATSFRRSLIATMDGTKLITSHPIMSKYSR